MKIEQLLDEVKIRFGTDWEEAEIEEHSYPFGKTEIEGGYSVQFYQDEGIVFVYNKNGMVYRNGVWATKKITEKPERWVVQKDENNPLWGKFIERYSNDRFSKEFFENRNNFVNQDSSFSLVLKMFKDHQYLTLEQWAKFFLDEPKVGDWGWFWDKDIKIKTFGKLTDIRYEKMLDRVYVKDDDEWFEVFKLVDISLPFSEILKTKPK